MVTIRFSQTWDLFHHSHRLTLEREVEQFLLDEGRYDCFPSLNYILAELAGNADKANLKRAHFQQQKLDLADPEQYAKGMASFKQAVSNSGDTLALALRNQKSCIKIWFGREEGNMVFSVFNNSPMLPIEITRFQDKVKMARQFQTIQEVMDYELDQSEGGGLGLIITVLMLRKIGIDETCLRLISTAEGTEARLVVPPLAEQGNEILATSVVEAIDQIPQFPDHVLKILRILEDPAKSFAHISPIIRQDSSLIASLLKAANSPLYNLHRTVESIDDAVAILGLPAIQEMLISVTAERLLVSTYHRAAVQRIMDHSLEVAWYCRELTKATKIGDNAANVYVCAMLHDFGEIVVNALVPGLTDKIAALCRAKGWNSFQAETLTNGFNHSLVGAALAKKWHFPEKIVEVIQYHHVPQEASRKAAPIVGLVYLGDFLWQKARDLVGWDALVPSVLETFPHKNRDEWISTFREVLEKRKAL